MQATCSSPLSETSCSSFVEWLNNEGGTALYVVKYSHINDYEGVIVACLEWSAALELCESLRANATGTEIFDTCEA
jgi:hypothetical protein